jgi:hypothetical protein
MDQGVVYRSGHRLDPQVFLSNHGSQGLGASSHRSGSPPGALASGGLLVVSGFRREWGREGGPRDEFTPLFPFDLGPHFGPSGFRSSATGFRPGSHRKSCLRRAGRTEGGLFAKLTTVPKRLYLQGCSAPLLLGACDGQPTAD